MTPSPQGVTPSPESLIGNKRTVNDEGTFFGSVIGAPPAMEMIAANMKLNSSRQTASERRRQPRNPSETDTTRRPPVTQIECVLLLFCTTKSVFVRISERELTFEGNSPTHLGELTFKNLDSEEQVGVPWYFAAGGFLMSEVPM